MPELVRHCVACTRVAGTGGVVAAGLRAGKLFLDPIKIRELGRVEAEDTAGLDVPECNGLARRTGPIHPDRSIRRLERTNILKSFSDFRELPCELVEVADDLVECGRRRFIDFKFDLRISRLAPLDAVLSAAEPSRCCGRRFGRRLLGRGRLELLLQGRERYCPAKLQVATASGPAQPV